MMNIKIRTLLLIAIISISLFALSCNRIEPDSSSAYDSSSGFISESVINSDTDSFISIPESELASSTESESKSDQISSSNQNTSNSSQTISEIEIEPVPAGPDESFYRVLPERSDEILINPGKGWILYDNSRGSFASQNDETWSYATVGYSRFSWSDIEKSDGIYDWKIVDNALEQCVSRGKTFSFGIMTSDPTSQSDYCTPKFILDMPDVNSLRLLVPNYSLPDASVPGGFRKMTKHIIDYTNPGEGFYRKLDAFALALADRYGNNTNIEYIDIRSFGSWGENSHAWLEGSNDENEEGYDEGIFVPERQDTGVLVEVMERCWESYINAFRNKRVQLMTAWGFGCNNCTNYVLKESFYKAIDQGVGIRRDGYSGYNSCIGSETLWGVNKVPTALEMASSYSWQKNNTGYDSQRLLDSPDENRASYYPLGTYNTDGILMLRELKQAVDEVTNRIGYHFVLAEAQFSRSVGIGETGLIKMKWLNDGTGKLFMKSRVSLALLDSTGKVIDTCDLDAVDPTQWVCAMDMVTENKFNIISSSFKFDKVPDGRYKLAVGLFTDKGTPSPDIRIGNKGRTADGWYVIFDSGENSINNTIDFTASAKLTISPVNGTSQQIVTDLGKVREFSSLEIQWGLHHARSYSVSVNNNTDESGWKQVYVTNDGKGGNEEITFPKTIGRYVRIKLSKPAVSQYDPYYKNIILPEVGRQLIHNGGFESNAYQWIIDDTSSAYINSDKTFVKTGSASLRLTKKMTVSVRHRLTRIFEQSGPGRYRIKLQAYSISPDSKVNMSIGVKGSLDDKTGIHWWAPKRYFSSETIELSANKWTTLEMEQDIQWAGLVEMAFLSIQGTAIGGLNMFIDDVSIVKISEIQGERRECYIPDEELFTINVIKIS